MKRCVALLAAFSAFAADLPVRHVILYKHGVGYFERSGRLAPGESARLDFNAADMNDVLKSLTLEEKGGGKISGLRYDASEPLEHKLAEFPFQLPPGAPLAAVLDQLKGARVEVKFGNETVAGAIVGGRVTAANEKLPEREQVTLLLDSGDLRTLDLAAASGLRFSDPKLQAQFRDYLAALTAARSKDKRSIYIDSTDAKAREVVADYMVPMPVWKSSYRLIFGDAPQPTLEGWAIVDNTTGEDWTNVQLSLVSGRPISFISKLYEPKYVARQTAELPEDRAQAPVVDTGAVAEERAASAGSRQFDAGRLMAKQEAMAAPAPALAHLPLRTDAVSSIATTAAARELGDLFEYRIATPVTVRKSESAMLPFLQQKVDARKLLIYSDQSSAHPMNAAEISNNTGKTLDGGPVTVYDAGAYGGEALVETFKSGDKRLISYAVDLGTRITTKFDSKGQIVRELHARNGILTTRVAALETRTYTIRNVDQKAKTLILEHPARPEYTLLDRKPTEKTATAYRFEVKLPPTGTETFPVSEERVYENSLALTNVTPDLLLSYLQNKSLSPAARKQLEDIARRKQRLAAADAEIRRLQASVDSIAQDQGRIRQNIDSLNRVSGQQQQVQSYAAQLAKQESTLAALRDHLAEQQKAKAALEGEINGLINSIDF